MRKYTLLLMALLTALTLLMAGCDKENTAATTNPSAAEQNSSKQGMSKPEVDKPATVEVKL